MAKRGGQRRMKAVAAPRAVVVGRKAQPWISRPIAGPHPILRAVPLAHVLKSLGVVQTSAEAKQILANRSVSVDGKVMAEMKHPVGLMDVISAGGKSWRALMDDRGQLIFKETSEKTKTCRIEKKLRTKGGKSQLVLSDGRTVIGYDGMVGDSLLLSLPDGKVLEKYPLARGAKGFVIGGAHVGHTGTVEEIMGGSATRSAQARVKIGDAEYTTLKKYIYPISGKEKL